MLKSDIIWPESRRYKSRTEWEPIGFFSDCLCNATQFDLMLGFFSSSAIAVLSDGFAAFLHNGGRMRLIINDILTDEDKSAIEVGKSAKELSAFNIDDIENLRNTLSARDKHFFECLSWLIRNNRIEIKIIAPKDGIGISHTKCGILSDGISKVAFDGSCNFSKSALVDNLESITASCDWDGKSEQAKIRDTEKDFNATFNENNENVKYVDASKIKSYISTTFQTKELQDLLEDENTLLENDIQSDLPITVKQALFKAKDKVSSVIKKHKEEEFKKLEAEDKPHFPYPSGPREYQITAFNNWKKNGQKGLFAMATGTGKTITSLNCLLEIYNRNSYYKAIILVPTVTLVNQWAEECKKFNFKNIVKVCSSNTKWKSEVDNITLSEQFNPTGREVSYIIISTYASYTRENVFSSLNEYSRKQVLMIADEAHNMGANQIKKKLPAIPYLRRIGLSATPERQFDEDGNRSLADFFGCHNGYTYEYSMKEAINNGVLCRYYYYPHLVRLTEGEMEKYVEISEKISKIYFCDEIPDHDDVLMGLLLARKRIVHKAANKKIVFNEILQQRLQEKGNLKYTLVYVPEGNEPDDRESDSFISKDTITDDDYSQHLIDQYTAIVRDVNATTTVKEFVSGSSDRDVVLKDFADGKLEVLTSMKCLDEGVDVPRSEMAIFCASTGNPRQFIQRRGRILRTHKDKNMAIIHDLIVAPEVSSVSDSYRVEQKLLRSELERVKDFALLAENTDATIQELEHILKYYNLSLF